LFLQRLPDFAFSPNKKTILMIVVQFFSLFVKQKQLKAAVIRLFNGEG